MKSAVQKIYYNNYYNHYFYYPDRTVVHVLQVDLTSLGGVSMFFLAYVSSLQVSALPSVLS